MSRFTAVLITATPNGLPPDQGAWTKIDGREAVLRSVELLLNRDPVTQILLVFDAETADEAKRKFGAHLSFSGVKLLTAGPSWASQLQAVAAVVSTDATHVLVHDAARPAVPWDDIDRLLEAAGNHPAVALSTLLTSAAIASNQQGPEIRPAGSQHVLMFPWVMRRKLFAELAALGALPSPEQLTLLPGSCLNQRVSGPPDAAMVRAMISLLPKPKLKAAANPFDEAQW